MVWFDTIGEVNEYSSRSLFLLDSLFYHSSNNCSIKVSPWSATEKVNEARNSRYFIQKLSRLSLFYTKELAASCETGPYKTCTGCYNFLQKLLATL
jgi:hypothetical protein